MQSIFVYKDILRHVASFISPPCFKKSDWNSFVRICKITSQIGYDLMNVKSKLFNIDVISFNKKRLIDRVAFEIKKKEYDEEREYAEKRFEKMQKNEIAKQVRADKNFDKALKKFAKHKKDWEKSFENFNNVFNGKKTYYQKYECYDYYHRAFVYDLYYFITYKLISLYKEKCKIIVQKDAVLPDNIQFNKDIIYFEYGKSSPTTLRLKNFIIMGNEKYELIIDLSYYGRYKTYDEYPVYYINIILIDTFEYQKQIVNIIRNNHKKNKRTYLFYRSLAEYFYRYDFVHNNVILKENVNFRNLVTKKKETIKKTRENCLEDQYEHNRVVFVS